MNFFANKNKSIETKSLAIEPLALYGSIAKINEFTYLRGIQEEVLEEWHKRRAEKDLIIKMNTGAGKTLTGLLILYSKMIESKKAVVYMCPDNQLYHQVIEQSKNYNIPTCTIENNDFPESFLNGESILVTTIQRMFNGKNIFNRDKIKLEAIVIDDAHKCVEKVIDSFTVKIHSEHILYRKLKTLFENVLKDQSLGSYEAMTQGEQGYYMKVPYWSWIDNNEQVISLLTEHITDIETMLFKYDLIIDNLSQYEMLINSNRIELSPLVSYVENIPVYSTANHRYALSATFVNDYSLVKDLNFSHDAVIHPITPKNRNDYGQRLILTPQRYFHSLSNDQQLQIIYHHRDNNQNVVILVPSLRVANSWGKLGAIVADKNNLEIVIEKLRTTVGNLVVFVNRYDGIDLGGDSCNVLVIHDYPRFKFIKEEYYQNIHHETSSNTVAQTLEQGMGRSVRSASDFSVVYLMGRYNLNFLRRKANLSFFNSHTRKQLEMGLTMLEGQKLDNTNAVQMVTEIADYCLRQDDEWKKFYKNYMDSNTDTEKVQHLDALKKHYLEKEAVYKFIKGEYREAVDIINGIFELGLSDIERAWYFQMQAHFAYKLNRNTSNEFQQKARTLSTKMYQPFLGKTKFKHQFSNSQYKKTLDFIQSFSTTNDIIDFLNEITQYLVYDPSNKAEKFEEALFKLGEFLGFDSSRPEKEQRDGGSDVLWVSQTHSYVLEAKSERLPENRISKSNIEQLYHSLEWFNEKYIYAGIVIGVTLQPNKRKNEDVTVNHQVKVLSQDSLDNLTNAVNELKKFLANNNITGVSENDVKTEFERLHLNSTQFDSKYLKTIS